ncbi:MAG TPA: hypothetical protein VNC78_02250 [Actinomycetota bacterium]|nr:hypothetical protein [Actinomycetota bacterium]
MRLDLISPRSTTGRWVVVPKSYEELARASFLRGQRRRKRILLTLVALVVGSATAAWIRGGSLWEIHLMADASLALYVSLLLEAKKRRIERKTKVRRIQRHITASEAGFYTPMEAGGHNS